MKKTFTHLRKGLMLIAAIMIIGVDLAFAGSIEGTKVYFEIGRASCRERV